MRIFFSSENLRSMESQMLVHPVVNKVPTDPVDLAAGTGVPLHTKGA
jgi:hypothetical protein